jgi:precorrin-6Y C5,15-methyltransferase (decarboxylating)
VSGPVLAVVGIGDDGPAGLGAAARACVERAELLVGGRRHLAMFPEHPADRVTIKGGLDWLVDRLDVEAARRRTVVLASGDPCFFGIGPLLAERLGRERVEIHPHVSAVALAFARLGLPWQDARVVSAHGRPLDRAVRRARGAGKLAVLTDDENTPAVVARALLAAGLRDDRAWVFEHLGGPNERAVGGRLSEIARAEYVALNVLVIPSATWDGLEQVFGRPVDAFEHAASLITKPEVRAISLSKLRVGPDSVLWDVGAGSGSLAIEAAGLTPRGRVFAIERSAEQAERLRRNVAAHARQAAVEIVQGAAPAALAALPDPDAVFIGGGGGELVEILDASFARLAPGARLVVNLATVERLTECLGWAKRRGVTAEVVQVQISRGAEIAGATRFQAENPVFVVTFERPA